MRHWMNAAPRTNQQASNAPVTTTAYRCPVHTTFSATWTRTTTFRFAQTSHPPAAAGTSMQIKPSSTMGRSVLSSANCPAQSYPVLYATQTRRARMRSTRALLGQIARQ